MNLIPQSEAAKKFGVSVSTLRRYFKEQIIKFRKTSPKGRMVQYSLTELEKIFNQ